MEKIVTMTDSQLIGYLMMLSSKLVESSPIESQACSQAAAHILVSQSVKSWSNKGAAE